MEENPEILQLYELRYSDLILLSSNKLPPSPEEIRRLETVSEIVMQNLGPTGPGLLSIVGVPKASVLRKALLPLARKLSLLNNDDRKLILKASMESFIVQVGESADVLSKGKLRAALHCVCRPKKTENLSRETFVVFLQPAWSKTFHLSDYPMERLTSSSQDSESYLEGTHGARKDSNGLTQKIHQSVPPLHSRLKDGMTFAEFSRETTKRYYGSSGLQPNR